MGKTLNDKEVHMQGTSVYTFPNYEALVHSLQLHEWIKRSTMKICIRKFRVRPPYGINHFYFYFTGQSEDQKIRNQSEDSNYITTCRGAGKCGVLWKKRKQDIDEHEHSLLEISNRKVQRREVSSSDTVRKLATLKHLLCLRLSCKYLYVRDSL